jgi:hypothetical protein
LQVDKSDDEQMDIACTQIQQAKILGTEMSCSQLLQQVMSQGNKDWPETEEMSSFLLHGPLHSYTALLTALDGIEVKKKTVLSIQYYANQKINKNNNADPNLYTSNFI